MLRLIQRVTKYKKGCPVRVSGMVRQMQADMRISSFAYTLTAGRVTQTVITDPRGNPTIHRFNAQCRLRAGG